MKGKLTMTDLRLGMGVDDIEVYIVKKQLGYIGHLARYEGHRIESSILGCALRESARTNMQMTTMKQYWTRIQQVMAKQTTYPEDEWPYKWMTVAKNNDGKQWRELSAKVVQDLRDKFDADTWEERHSAENERKKQLFRSAAPRQI